jgi:hypothetical protein
MSNLCYPKQLQKLKLPTLAYRRIHGDIIELVADLSSLSNLDSNVTIFLAVTTDSGKLFQVSTDQYINEYLLMFSLGQILKIL